MKSYSIPEKAAIVSITDGSGNVEVLTESSPGVYNTSALLGRINEKYQLNVTTSEGTLYASAFEELKPVAKSKSIDYKYVIYDVLFFNANGEARSQKVEGFIISASLNDPPGERNFYRWQVDGIFEYIAISLDPTTVRCWAPQTRLESRVQIASDLYFDGQSYSQEVAIVNYTRPTKYLVKLRQQSLSEDAYTFLKGISNQQTTTGTLFDPPPTPFLGNVKRTDNEMEVVLGYFGASAVEKSELLIDRFLASGNNLPSNAIPPRAGDCRLHEPNATNIKPSGF